MRSFAPVVTLLAFLVLVGNAAAGQLPASGYVVYKEMRSHAVTDVRDKVTGKVVSSTVSFGETSAVQTACGDSRHKFLGPSWRAFEPYLVNVGSTPPEIAPAATLAQIQAGHAAWEDPLTTDCSGFAGTSAYRSIYGGTTARDASLAASLATDGANVVAFRSLAGTVCDGAAACVVIDYKGSSILEADMALERDLTRYGFEDYWTNDDTTVFHETGGQLAVIDAATHEWGHFAGLGHVAHSPTLTMFPVIRDGAQTLGLGDMKGIAARYARYE